MTKPKRILIADDDRALVEVLDIRCRELGLETIPAYDAVSALMLARQHHPDVICLDVNMPMGDGLSVREMLLGDETLASIPVVVLTGRTDKETVIRCHATCAYYVLKSTDVWPRLHSALSQILDLPGARPKPPPHVEPEPPPPLTPSRSLHHIMAALVPDVDHTDAPGAK